MPCSALPVMYLEDPWSFLLFSIAYICRYVHDEDIPSSDSDSDVDPPPKKRTTAKAKAKTSKKQASQAPESESEARTLTHTRVRVRAHAHTCTNTHIHTHIYSQTHTKASPRPSPSPAVSRRSGRAATKSQKVYAVDFTPTLSLSLTLISTPSINTMPNLNPLTPDP